MAKLLTRKEYLKELVEELITAAREYGENPRSNYHEWALGDAAEQLYTAIETMVPEEE